MRKFFALISLVFVSAFVTITPLHAQMNTSSVLSLINSQRRAVGLAEVASNAKLNQAAQMKADDMAAKSYFAHVGPDGNGPTSWLAAVGYQWSSTGEILAYNSEESESAIVTSWMNSPEHKAIILDGRYSQTGIGIAVGTYQGMRVVFVAEEFGMPKTSSVSVQATAPAPVATPKPVIASTQTVQPVVTIIPVIKSATKPVVIAVAKTPAQAAIVSAPKIVTVAVQAAAGASVPANTAVATQISWMSRLENFFTRVFTFLTGRVG